MKNQPNRIIFFFLSFLISLGVHAQIKDVANMLSGSKEDAQKLFQAYLKPYANAFGADLNGGWYTTAKPHKLLGFDLTASINVAFVPKADKEFDATKLGLTGTVTPPTPYSPTIAGKKETGQTISYYPQLGGGLSYKTPKGTGLGFIPSPVFQLGLGVVKETDITVRYVPTLKFGDYGSVDLWGVGLKHSIKQWIPGLKLAPFFHLSFFGGYTQLRTNVNLNLKPSFYNDQLNPDPTLVDNLPYDNQKMELLIKGLTFNILASFDLPVIAVYGGVGLSNTNTTLKLLGDFPMLNVSGTTAEIVNMPNPINIKMKSADGSTTKPRLNAGFKLKMAILHIHFDYTYANYSVASFGLGISFR